MSTFPEKLKAARKERHFSQPDLAKMVGISTRSVAAYEMGEKYPRRKTMLKLAEALNVSSRYLTYEECEDPQEGIENDAHYKISMEYLGAKKAAEFDRLMEENKAFFAGGDYDADQKELLFNALMEAYVLSKQKAHEKFTPNKYKKDE